MDARVEASLSRVISPVKVSLERRNWDQPGTAFQNLTPVSGVKSSCGCETRSSIPRWVSPSHMGWWYSPSSPRVDWAEVFRETGFSDDLRVKHRCRIDQIFYRNTFREVWRDERFSGRQSVRNDLTQTQVCSSNYRNPRKNSLRSVKNERPCFRANRITIGMSRVGETEESRWKGRRVCLRIHCEINNEEGITKNVCKIILL